MLHSLLSMLPELHAAAGVRHMYVVQAELKNGSRGGDGRKRGSRAGRGEERRDVRHVMSPTIGRLRADDQSRQYLFVRDNGSVEVNRTVSYNDCMDPVCCRSREPAADDVRIYYFDQASQLSVSRRWEPPPDPSMRVLQDPFKTYAIPCTLKNCCNQGCKPFQVGVPSHCSSPICSPKCPRPVPPPAGPAATCR